MNPADQHPGIQVMIGIWFSPLLPSALLCVALIFRQALPRWWWNGYSQHLLTERVSFPVILAHLPGLTDDPTWIPYTLWFVTMAMGKQYPDWPGLGYISTFWVRRHCPWVPKSRRNKLPTPCFIRRGNRCLPSKKIRYPVRQKLPVLFTAAHLA